MDSLERAYLYSNFLTGARISDWVLAPHASQHASCDSCQRCVHYHGGSRHTTTTSASFTLVLSLIASRVMRMRRHAATGVRQPDGAGRPGPAQQPSYSSYSYCAVPDARRVMRMRRHAAAGVRRPDGAGGPGPARQPADGHAAGRLFYCHRLHQQHLPGGALPACANGCLRCMEWHTLSLSRWVLGVQSCTERMEGCTGRCTQTS